MNAEFKILNRTMICHFCDKICNYPVYAAGRQGDPVCQDCITRAAALLASSKAEVDEAARKRHGRILPIDSHRECSVCDIVGSGMICFLGNKHNHRAICRTCLEYATKLGEGK